jgi:ribonuclease HII
MDILDKNHPQYFFGEHKGYGTQKHIDAIKLHGPCKWHRKTFEPLHSLFFDLFAAAK